MGTQELARWAIRLSIGFYVARTTLQLRRRESIPSVLTLLLWSGGCLCYLLHVLWAMDGFHGWSHDRAIQFTADETYRVMGIRRGEGLWVNYLMCLVWVGDCLRLRYCHRARIPTRRSTDSLVAVFFALMMFSATVLFGPPTYIFAFLALSTVWCVLIARRWKDRLDQDLPAL